LGGWEGYEVESVEQPRRAGTTWCVIRLRPLPGQRRCCGGCGRAVSAIHDLSERRIRDLPIFEHPVELIVPRLRLACPVCGPKLERLVWLELYARVTARLAASVARLCAVMTVLHVARFYALDWKTVKRIDQRALQRTLGPIDLSEVEIIGLDEFALHRGHRYAIVVVEPSRKRVLWVARGRSRAELRPFFELLGPAGCARLKAAVMDMNTAFDLEVRAHCPQAEIVYDLFHVLAKYGREVTDRVRVDQANALRHDQRARHVIKGARWLLLKNRDSLPPDQDQALEDLLEANRPLYAAYVMRDALRDLWSYRHRGYAERAWQSWYRKALRSGVEPLIRFARKLRLYLPGILAHARFPLGTNLIEGINNRIKVIKRMAYGYRDEAYFFLKIRAAFPGVGR
jgi:transposase